MSMMPLRYTLGEVSEDRRDRQRDVALAGVLASRQCPGLKMTVEFHPGWDTHVMGTSVVRGLRTLYAK